MIHETKPLSLAEVEDTINKTEAKEDKKEIRTYLKRFKNLNLEKSLKLKQELKNLKILKIKPEHIAKVIDLLPEDETDINKIFTESSLTKDETTKILETIKKYK